MITLHKMPQIDSASPVVLAAKGEKLAITAGEETKVYDLSCLEAGQYLLDPDGYLIAARREEDGIHVDVLWPIGKDASEEDRFPEPEALKDVSKLPAGEPVGLVFVTPQPPGPTPEERISRLEDDLLLSYEVQAELYETALAQQESVLDTQLALAEVYEMMMGG